MTGVINWKHDIDRCSNNFNFSLAKKQRKNRKGKLWKLPPWFRFAYLLPIRHRGIKNSYFWFIDFTALMTVIWIIDGPPLIKSSTNQLWIDFMVEILKIPLRKYKRQMTNTYEKWFRKSTVEKFMLTSAIITPDNVDTWQIQGARSSDSVKKT